MQEEDTVDYLIIAICIGTICAALSWLIASNRGASAGAWAALGFLLGPIGLLVTLVAAKPETPHITRRCGQCGQPLNPLWKAKCLHCGVAFAEAPPV